MVDKFVGCATDSRFAEPTAVMLSSLEANGAVHDAQILVASFGLTANEKNWIRIGSGYLSERLRFIDVTQDMVSHIKRDYVGHYSPAIMGRFFFVNQISSPGARLLFLDSDMVINASIRPLFDLDMGDEFFAAVHDLPRKDDLNYFNAGLMLTKVDDYKYHRINDRCLDWLTDNPNAPLGDQDALNAIIGDSWYRLDPCWNRYLAEDRNINLHDYETARIAHFADEKPWQHPNHVGLKLYEEHRAVFAYKMRRSSSVGFTALKTTELTCSG